MTTSAPSNRRRKIGRDAIEFGKAGAQAAGVDAAGGAKRGQLGVDDVMEPHRVASGAQMGDEVEAAVSRADHRDRLRLIHESGFPSTIPSECRAGLCRVAGADSLS
jgi:hypothetical protein